MAVQINQYIDTPFGKLHIYADDPARLVQAKRLIDKTPNIMFDAYKDAASRFGAKIMKEARRCIDSQQPPKGASWPPLSPKYVEFAGGDDRIYFKTAQYYESIGVYKEKVEYYGTNKTGARYFVGLPNGVKKWPVRYGSESGQLTIQQVARILEMGTRNGKIPQRPLWKPLYEHMGGKKRIETYVRNAVKRQLSKYL